MYVRNDKFNMVVQKGSKSHKIIEGYHFRTLQFVINLWTALFNDKATFIDPSKTPIFEREVTIPFIHLWVDKVVLVSMIFQMLQQSPADKQEYYSGI